MTVTPDTPWRSLPAAPAGLYERVLAGSWLAPDAERVARVAGPLSLLMLGQVVRESGLPLSEWSKATRNPLNLRPRPGDTRPTATHPRDGAFLAFEFPDDFAREYVFRLTDPGYKGGVYARTTTLRELVGVFAPAGDGANDPDAYAAALATDLSFWLEEADVPDLDMTKGLVPLPAHTKRLILNKPAGVGWDDLGRRTPRGITLHRMQGTLWGTDGHFRNPAVGALTDFGVDHQTGECLQWCDPTGTRTPWASGPVKDPYGDGAAFIAKYAGPSGVGVSVVNRDRVSVEVAGFFVQPGEVAVESPWSEASRQVVARICGHYAHDYGIAWSDYPIHPDDGFSFLAWHHEFTRGTGKLCPGRLLMEATPDLVERTRAILKAAQTRAAPTPVPTPTPGIAYPDGMYRELAAEAFGEAKDAAGKTYRFDEAGPVSRLWLDAGAAAEPDRYPGLAKVIAGRAAEERFFLFAGGLLIRQKGRLVEVVNASNREAA